MLLNKAIYGMIIIPGAILKVKRLLRIKGGYLMNTVLAILLGAGALFGLYRFDQWLTN